jgi:alkanesulfonate monooxygenase SsuD/methylene tetrahydromethanopterin reductase-like flavin-dependent oxidoreductase (luciferase family)
MRYGIHIPNFGPFGDARVMAHLAAQAEAAGWDGVFVWDHVIRHEGDFNLVDPWVALTAIAVATSTVTLGPLVTPLPRRRPWNVAKVAANLDHLSGGRIVLGVGVGSPRGEEFGAFGEEADTRRRGDMLDEGLELLHEAWSGEPVHHAGEHYQVESRRFLPRPLQEHGIPVWAGTESVAGRAVRRAARLDGVFPIGIQPDDLPRLLASLADAGRHLPGLSRPDDDAGSPPEPVRPFDIVITGTDDAVRWEDTAATWWLRMLPWEEPLETSRRIVAQGPRR